MRVCIRVRKRERERESACVRVSVRACVWGKILLRGASEVGVMYYLPAGNM